MVKGHCCCRFGRRTEQAKAIFSGVRKWCCRNGVASDFFRFFRFPQFSSVFFRFHFSFLDIFFGFRFFPFFSRFLPFFSVSSVSFSAKKTGRHHSRNPFCQTPGFDPREHPRVMTFPVLSPQFKDSPRNVPRRCPWWPHIARYCDMIAAIPHIARYFLREVSTPPKWCDTPLGT